MIQPAAGGGDGGAGELPGGIVTMLFSDIEGSTMLLGRLGEAYGEALSAQQTILRAAIGQHRGRELGTEGDSFFVVFSSASDAVLCCVAAQRALAAYDWPGGAAVRVRMGLHAGEPARHFERAAWDAELAAGRALTQEQAVALLRSPAPGHPPSPVT